ncbi:hypothetical protein LG634_31525 [Streptomyces bambusae]|uniref:hypothetical protein n=1 Tax=Streptomyces bambusae TaxID=1550616 RepID=UPI001CFFC5B9|nr:hypothetical protein [Streptomyces bambusae]MCB5169328.1 hypothetical protein [Streptomyces bambusae]
MTTTKMTDRSVAVSCMLGSASVVSLLPSAQGTRLSADLLGSAATLASLPVRERIEGNERPTQAPVAVLAQAHAYAFEAAGAGFPKQQTTQHHTMWAFRGLEPWSDPA